jgi:fumarylpyruvate hydrolase
MPKLPVLVPPTAGIGGSSQRFPIRRIFCVGQNYAEHAREMGSDSDRNPPFFFSKPADAVVPSGSRLRFPSRTGNLHHEVELVVALGAGGSRIPLEQAPAMIFGWAVGLDLTRRDLQLEAKQLGRPWDMAKGFDQSAPLGLITVGAPPATGRIELTVDGVMRQSADIAEMIWSVAEIIVELSTYVSLAPGDLIFTGTPAGVGPVLPGQTVRGSLTGTGAVEISFDSADAIYAS